MKFQNKAAMITGAAVGIGRACAHRFAKYEAKVAIVDIDGEKLENVSDAWSLKTVWGVGYKFEVLK